MEFSSSLLAGAPESHLSLLMAVIKKSFLHHGNLKPKDRFPRIVTLLPVAEVGKLSHIYKLTSGLAPPALSYLCLPLATPGQTCSSRNPHLLNLSKSRLVAHLHSFFPLSSRLWNHFSVFVVSSSLRPGNVIAITTSCSRPHPQCIPHMLIVFHSDFSPAFTPKILESNAHH